MNTQLKRKTLLLQVAFHAPNSIGKTWTINEFEWQNVDKYYYNPCKSCLPSIENCTLSSGQ